MSVTPTDRIRSRTVENLHSLIQEHLEAMQRDVHGLEYEHWKLEVDVHWRRIFEEIGHMREGPQQSALQMIREEWTRYLKHYVTLSA